MMWGRRVLFAIALAMIAGGFGPSVAMARDLRDFKIVNVSSRSIFEVYVSPAGAKEWGRDLLGRTGIADSGETVTITFAYPSDECVYDVKAVDQEGEAWEEYDIDLCTTNLIYLHDDGLWME